MNHKTYCAVSATLFAVVALAHLVRLLNSWLVEINATAIPMGVSWVGFIVPAALAVWGFREVRKAG